MSVANQLERSALEFFAFYKLNNSTVIELSYSLASKGGQYNSNYIFDFIIKSTVFSWQI